MSYKNLEPHNVQKGGYYVYNKDLPAKIMDDLTTGISTDLDKGLQTAYRKIFNNDFKTWDGSKYESVRASHAAKKAGCDLRDAINILNIKLQKDKYPLSRT